MTHEEFIDKLEITLRNYYMEEFGHTDDIVRPEDGIYSLMYTERSADIDEKEERVFNITTTFDSNTLEYIDSVDGEEVQRGKFINYEDALGDIELLTFQSLLESFPTEILDKMYKGEIEKVTKAYAVVLTRAHATEDFGDIDGVVYYWYNVDQLLNYLQNTYMDSWGEYMDYEVVDKDTGKLCEKREIEIFNLTDMKSEGKWELKQYKDDNDTYVKKIN